MPILSYFFGIYIRMYHDDHHPPHFHAEYQGHEAYFSIETGEIIEGHFPKKAAKIVKEWCIMYQNALWENWQKAITLQPLNRIPGADND